MHELSIAEALVDELLSVAEAEGARRIVSLSIAVGSLSGVEPDALAMAFPVAAEGSLAENASLQVDRVVAQAECRDCRRRFVPEFPFFVCEHCGSTHVTVTGGRDLMITRVDLDVAEPGAGPGRPHSKSACRSCADEAHSPSRTDPRPA